MLDALIAVIQAACIVFILRKLGYGYGQNISALNPSQSLDEGLGEACKNTEEYFSSHR